MAGRAIATAIARVVPAIHFFFLGAIVKEDVDARHKAGHDGCGAEWDAHQSISADRRARQASLQGRSNGVDRREAGTGKSLALA
jgi:hypothetical protein